MLRHLGSRSESSFLWTRHVSPFTETLLLSPTRNFTRRRRNGVLTFNLWLLRSHWLHQTTTPLTRIQEEDCLPRSLRIWTYIYRLQWNFITFSILLTWSPAGGSVNALWLYNVHTPLVFSHLGVFILISMKDLRYDLLLFFDQSPRILKFDVFHEMYAQGRWLYPTRVPLNLYVLMFWFNFRHLKKPSLRFTHWEKILQSQHSYYAVVERQSNPLDLFTSFFSSTLIPYLTFKVIFKVSFYLQFHFLHYENLVLNHTWYQFSIYKRKMC